MSDSNKRGKYSKQFYELSKSEKRRRILLMRENVSKSGTNVSNEKDLNLNRFEDAASGGPSNISSAGRQNDVILSLNPEFLGFNDSEFIETENEAPDAAFDRTLNRSLSIDNGTEIIASNSQLVSPDEAESLVTEPENSDAETVSSHEIGSENGEEFELSDEEETDNNSDYNFEEMLRNSDPPSIALRCRQKMKEAFLIGKLNHTQGNVILRALRDDPFRFLCLPKDSRTIFDTPSFVASRFVENIGGGEYLHFGFKSVLLKKLESLPVNELPSYIEIDFSTDGGKLDNGGAQFWPLQFRIYNITDKKPLIVGVYIGKKKPSDPHSFFEKFGIEILDIFMNGGVVVRGVKLPLKLRCFIADAPARAFILNHYGHTSSNACSKCKIEGYRVDNTMVFRGTRHPPRTDEEYWNLIDEDHHKGDSPLAALGMGLVTRVPIEGMHNIWLGNVKKIIRALLEGKFKCAKLSGHQINIINARIAALIKFCPAEFGRKPNEISGYSNFKAVEFRQFLLYYCITVMKDVINEEYYLHLTLLHCIIRLLCSDGIAEWQFTFCKAALEMYVSMCETLYGEKFLSYNIHAILHIVDDVKVLGPLESFSAFCYENNMPEFRKFIRKPHQRLQQACKRFHEINEMGLTFDANHTTIRASITHVQGPLPPQVPLNCFQFQKLEIGKVTFQRNIANNCCILKDGTVCIIENIIQVEEKISLVIRKFGVKDSFYNIGLSSQAVGVYYCHNLSHDVVCIELKELKAKCYRMPRWSSKEGQEETLVRNQWICATLLTPLSVPENH